MQISPTRWLALVLAAAFAAGPALADKDGHGKNKGKHEQKADKHGSKHDKQGRNKGDRDDDDDRRGGRGDDDRQARDGRDRQDGPRNGAYFNDRHRDAVRTYYVSNHRNCPPGLARKNNGCMPPGQAKKWNVGQRIPAGVTVYTVPQPILVTLPPPPPQHRYVRVAGDILLIAVGTSMVVDGISGIMR